MAGGYTLIDASDAADLPPGAPVVNVAAVGSVVTEAIEAVDFLIREEVAANLLVVSSPDRLSAEMHGSRLAAARSGRNAPAGHLETLFPKRIRHAPVVTVVDGASHTLSFIGAAFGVPVVPLGVDSFGQSGTIGDLYRQAGISTSDIIDGALLAIEMTEPTPSRSSALA
jgi:pyruvate dehydrogenase E1 component